MTATTTSYRIKSKNSLDWEPVAQSWDKNPEVNFTHIYKPDWSIDSLRTKFNVEDIFSDLDEKRDYLISSNFAISFLSKLGEKSIDIRKQIRLPDLHPAGGGTVDLFWEGNPSLLINFDHQNQIYAFFGESASRGTTKGTAPIGIVRYELIQWLEGFNV